LVKHDYRVALLVSLLIYITVYLTGFNLDAENGVRGWYFNPFAWQLLYTIGMVVYHLSRTAPDKLFWNRRWLGLAIGFIIFGAIAATPWKVGGMDLNAPLPLWLADKTFLAPLRVVNVLAMLYVFVFFVPPQAAAL
jgi:hypothetical protein